MLDGLPDLPETHQLDTSEAALIAGRHRRTIVAWIRQGHLPARRSVGVRGQYRIVYRDLKELLERPAFMPES